MSKRHCWADKFEVEGMQRAYDWASGEYTEPDWTCLLEAGHDGPHEWSDLDGIEVVFLPS